MNRSRTTHRGTCEHVCRGCRACPRCTMAQFAVEWAKGVKFDWTMDRSRLGTTAMSTGTQGPPGQATQGESGGEFRASDLIFSHPDLEESYGTGDIIFASRETIYREVCSFCRRVADYAILKGKATARANLSTCFRATALYWWLNTLSQDEKDTIKENSFVDQLRLCLTFNLLACIGWPARCLLQAVRICVLTMPGRLLAAVRRRPLIPLPLFRLTELVPSVPLAVSSRS